MSVYSTAILAESSLINYWQLNETTGTAAADSKGSSGLTYSGGFTLNQAGPAGVNDVGVAFNGTTGVASRAAAPGTQSSPFSIEGWIKTATSTHLGAWFNAFNGSANNVSLYANTPSLLGMSIGTGSAWLALTTMTYTYADSNWHHIVVTAEATASKIYLDGVLILNTTYASNTPQLWTTSVPIQIGAYVGGSQFWSGSICQVAVYNSALNLGQIRAHYWLGSGVSTPPLIAPSVPVPMTSLVSPRRTAMLCVPMGRYGLLAPTDTVSNSVGTLGATKPILVSSPWGNALNFANGTNQVTFSKASMLKSEGPWTLAFLGRINGIPVINGGSRSGLIGLSTSGSQSLWLGYDQISGLIDLLKGSTAVASGLYPRWGDWAFYAVTWDGKSIQQFYIYDWETGTFQYASVSESTTSGQSTQSDLAPSFGPVFGGTTGNFSLFDIVSFVIDRTAWTQADFMRFAADPYYPIRSPSRLSFKFASVPPGAPVPAALLPAM